MKKRVSYFASFLSMSLLMGVSKCESPHMERDGKPPIDEALEQARRESAQHFEQPRIYRLVRNGKVVWSEGQSSPQLLAGEILDIEGEGFGAGPEIDYSKILVGKIRVLESDIKMYTGHVDIKKAHYFEENKVFDEWAKEIISWTPTRIRFRVPVTTNRGPLVVSVQKRVGSNLSLSLPDEVHSVWDPNSERIGGFFSHKSDVVSKLSEAKLSNAVELSIENKNFKERVLEGQKIFWSYDFNIGSVHNARDLDWKKILEKNALNPITGEKIDPVTTFGAIPITPNLQLPKIARETISFDPYPMPSPLTSVLSGKQLYSGETEPTGYVGYIYASSLSAKTGTKGKWAGFSCVSCHAQAISFPDSKGKTVTRVFPGLPNPEWSLKWTALTKFKGVKGEEEGIEGEVDKSMLIYHMPKGTGEHSLIRSSKDKHSPYHNDFLFSPIAIPNVTTHTPLRRSLSHTEFYAGFEGSYVHSEEPDGAIGSMFAEPLKSLTAYMGVLSKDDELLQKIGIYRWLKEKDFLSDLNSVSEKKFLYSNLNGYPKFNERLERGKNIYSKNCISCHATNFGTGSDENMFPINEVGTYFSPTIFQKEVQGIRSGMMTHLYWVQKRGLLHDTHVRSLEDLVSPDRCNPQSKLYKKYYTLHKDSFKIPVGTPAQAKVTGKHAYFVRVDWDSEHFYWDYQKMLREFGPLELGSKQTITLPKMPHPWCASSNAEVDDLVAYLLTL